LVRKRTTVFDQDRTERHSRAIFSQHSNPVRSTMSDAAFEVYERRLFKITPQV
jgi:hypothetical protein